MTTMHATPLAEEEYMEINTRYGTQVVARSSLLKFPEGLPGFEDLHEYKLFHEEGTSTVYYLQSTEDADVRLPVVTPASCQIDYRIELSDEEESKLQIQAGDDILVMVTVSENHDDPQAGITANLMAPIIINAHSRIGLQKTLNQVNGAVVINAA